MGTRSTIHFYDGTIISKNHLVTIYQQYDGYLDGVGKELYEFLFSHRIVNGFSLGDSSNNAANGMQCLAAQFIAKFKTDIGGLYITNKTDTQEYDYHVGYTTEYQIKVVRYNRMIFQGTLQEFLSLIQKEE